jgi:mono/diheme cytochrome c family protein
LRREFATPLLVVALVVSMSIPMPLEPKGESADVQYSGDFTRGEELFGEKGCNGCHRIKGIGGQVGPDLTSVFRLDLAKDRPRQTQADVTAYVRQSIRADALRRGVCSRSGTSTI